MTGDLKHGTIGTDGKWTRQNLKILWSNDIYGQDPLSGSRFDDPFMDIAQKKKKKKTKKKQKKKKKIKLKKKKK